MVKVYSVKQEPEEMVKCPHCSSRNPKGMYCCLVCTRVMVPQKKNVLQFFVPPSIAYTLIVCLVFWVGLHIVNEWVIATKYDLADNVGIRQERIEKIEK